MEKALDAILERITRGIKDKVDADLQGLHDASIELMGGGEESFEFYLDDNGKTEATTKPYYTGGVTIDCTVWIEAPDAIYQIEVTSSAGTKEKFPNKTINDEMKFKLKTSWKERTTATVKCTANVTNTKGTGKIKFSY